MPQRLPGFRKLNASLRARVFLPSALLFTVTLGLMVLAAVEMLGRDLEKNVRHRAEMFVDAAAEGLSSEMLHSGRNALPVILTMVDEHRQEVISVSLMRPDGTVISSSNPKLIDARPWPTLPGGEKTEVRPVNSDQFAVLRPIQNAPGCAGCHGSVSKVNGWIDARFSRDPVQTAKKMLAGELVVAAVPALIILLASAYWLLGREVVNPLQRLVRAMRLAEEGDASIVADEGRPDELGVAARGFDATFAALKRSTRELELVYAERMVRADRFAAVGEMATGLAHEIKNPLAGLSGALELLAEDLAGTGSKAEVVAEMQHQVQRLTRTMEGLLNFARPPRARMQRMELTPVIEAVLFLVGQQHSETPVEIKFVPDPSLPALHGDPGQIEQVLLNLCLNALQAMNGKGGTLTVTSFVRDEFVVVQVGDTGPGIPLEVRAHVFTPFFTTRKDGNGLGLATSARIVAEHRGQIEFDCPPEGGTLFSLSLPVEQILEMAA